MPEYFLRKEMPIRRSLLIKYNLNCKCSSRNEIQFMSVPSVESIDQSAEQKPFNPWVVDSIPTGPTAIELLP